jgi:hypothetical protein
MVSRHVQSQVFIGIFVLLLLSACKQYSANVEDFFSYWSEKAVITGGRAAARRYRLYIDANSKRYAYVAITAADFYEGLVSAVSMDEGYSSCAALP